jgi:hypothetical protein
MADIVDLNIYPTIETVDVTIQTIIDNVAVTIQPTNNPVNLTITPNLITINVNQVTGGGAVSSVNTLVGDVVLTQDTILDGSTFKQYSLTEKNKLAGIAAGAEVNVNADWNATTGDAQILNKPTIPAAVTQTSQLTNNGADGVNPFITALDIPTTGQASTIVREVKNMTGATLTKGTVVYISGANGNKALVSKALATTDALSSRTFGLLQSDILNNGLGYCVVIGDLSGLNTSAFTEGDQLYLSGVTAGTYTATKILAPTHLVYVGKITRVHPTQGQIEVGIQNGYEISEIHDIAINGLANNQLLSYDSATSLWKNKNLNQIVSERRNANNSANNNINYCGTAANGSAEASAVWTIKRLTIAASGSITILTATNVAWTNRESATYI